MNEQENFTNNKKALEVLVPELKKMIADRPIGEQADILIALIDDTNLPRALARMVNAYFNC